MARCLQLAAMAARSDVPVVLLGETGTGKTLLAQAIHNSSARANRPFIAFNASAISDTLLESQLFGHERGAFTGAQQTVKGKFELANEGTLFLDEISEMSPLAQVKILRVLEWIIDRCEQRRGALQSPIGWLPSPHDLDLDGLEIDHKCVAEILGIDHEEWAKELAEHKKFFDSLGGVVPQEFHRQQEQLAARFKS